MEKRGLDEVFADGGGGGLGARVDGSETARGIDEDAEVAGEGRSKGGGTSVDVDLVSNMEDSLAGAFLPLLSPSAHQKTRPQRGRVLTW
jgi:hypothetical protein